MNEKPAKGVRGFLLYNPSTDRHFLRVYGDIDPATGRNSFTDYKLSAEDIQITIESHDLSLYDETEEEKSRPLFDEDNHSRNEINWSSSHLW